jgi:hypothetical protein
VKTIKELIQEEKYNNMLKRKNKHIKKLKEDLKDYKYIGIMQFSRPYAKRYLEERRKEIHNLLYPDSEEIYIDYFDLKERIARANNFIDQVLLYRIPNKTKEVYEDIETLQNILNGVIKIGK